MPRSTPPAPAPEDPDRSAEGGLAGLLAHLAGLLERLGPQGAPERAALRSTGREPWVFRAAEPGDLLGAHVESMASALAPEEGLEYLLYAPIFDARRTPFGLRCEPASHAFAVTRPRFVLSTDTHREGEEATVESIPFDRILAVEWGDSLLEGWVALHFADGGRTGVVSWTYRATTGRKHVSRALQAYRRLTTHPVPGSAGRGSAAAALAAYPATLRDEIEPLLLESERLLDLAQSHELWHRPRRRPWKCLAAAGLLLATDRGLLHAERAPRAHPSRLELGRRGHCFPWETFAGWVDRGELDGLRRLSLRLERAGAALEVPLAVAPATAARLRTLVPGGRGREGR